MLSLKKLFFKVKAQSIFGNKAFSLQTYKVQINHSSSKDLRIPIHKCSNSEFIDNNSVVGIPFSEGQFWIGDKLEVDAIEQRRLVDYQPTSFWSDGSIKWIKVFLRGDDLKKDICYLKKIRRDLQTDDVLYSESDAKQNFKCGEYDFIFEENQPILIENKRSSETFLETSLTLSNEKIYFSNRVSNLKIYYHNPENLHLFFEMFIFKNEKFEIKKLNSL